MVTFIDTELHLGHHGAADPSPYLNALLIPGLSLGHPEATSLSVWQPGWHAISGDADNSLLPIHSLAGNIATRCSGLTQHEASEGHPFIDDIQTPVDFSVQQAFSQAPSGGSQFRGMFYSSHVAHPKFTNILDLDLDFNALHAFQAPIQDVADNYMILTPPFSAAVPTSDLLIPTRFGAQVAAPAPAPVPSKCHFVCTNCNKIFKRDSDRIGHENSIHFNHHGAHLCPIVGCAKAQGKGFSRPDKVTEHLWKCHGDLGFLKRT